jgi:arylsulfatase A
VYAQDAKTGYFPEKFYLEAMGGAEVSHALYTDSEVGTSLKNKVIDYIRTLKN